ncbi:MAG TPA: serpin family protein [Burkholderiaceae bacterium]
MTTTMHFSPLLELMAVSLLLNAWGRSGGNSAIAAPGSARKSRHEMSLRPRDLNPQVSADDMAAVGNSITKFAFNTFHLLAPDSAGNTVYSPCSATLAVALATAGARGNTLTGINQALFFSLPQTRLNPALNKLNLELKTKSAGEFEPQNSHVPHLHSTSAIWTQSRLKLLPSYLNALAQDFGTGVNQIDFASSPVAARMDINAWAAQRTNGHITNLVPIDAIGKSTRMLLTNAVSFTGGWLNPFDAMQTKSAQFHAIEASTANVPFMHQVGNFPYYSGDDAQAVELPYVGGNLAMLIVMPDAGTWAAYQSGLTLSSYNDLVSRLKTDDKLALSLPKFSLTGTPDFNAALQGLGMADAFDPAKADFSGIDGRRDLSIQTIFQQARVSVDEQGTDVAAATAATAGITAIEGDPAPQISIVVDHPFLFFIRDRRTGTILFMGKVANIQCS